MTKALAGVYSLPARCGMFDQVGSGQGMVDDLQKMRSQLAGLGARVIIQRAVEE